MTADNLTLPSMELPTRLSTAIFQAKVTAFRVRRTLTELGRAPKRLARTAASADFGLEIAESSTELWADPALAERNYQLGKVHNLRRAAMALDGLLLPAGQPFSFWRQVGKATKARGYVEGRMLREGCMVAAVGGGLCQLSNALYDAAEKAGCRILERHGHSRIVPGSAAAVGRDATVAWNYVDLRFAAPADMLLRVRLDARQLTVSFHAREPVVIAAPEHRPEPAFAPLGPAARSCGMCDETECFLHEHGRRAPKMMAGRTAYLVDEAWPEFTAYVGGGRRPDDLICAPTQARWPGAEDAPLAAAARSWAWRATPAQGAARRKADADTTGAIARALAARMGPEDVEAVVAQSFLPTLWREGWLGGRGFTVLMTRLPIAVLQARLDAASAAHPDRATLADHRAPAWMADAEAEALAAADRIVTPHAEIAALFPRKAVLLDWVHPAAPAPRPRCGHVIAFAGPTVARKGAYEVREAARKLGFTLRPVGSELEGPDFWSGVKLDRDFDRAAWLQGVAAVAQPALAEGAPRALLQALAAGVPVIATEACGLPPQPGLTLVPMGDAGALAAAIQAFETVTVSG